MGVKEEWDKIESVMRGEVDKVDSKVNSLTPRQKYIIGAVLVIALIVLIKACHG